MAFDATGLKEKTGSDCGRVIGSCVWTTRMLLCAIAWLMLGFGQVAIGQQGGIQPGNPFSHYRMEMYDRPALTVMNSYPVYQDGLKELWLMALDRNDAELQRLVIDSIGLAHRHGDPSMAETVDRLAAILDQPDARLDVQRAVAQSLVGMDAKQHADKLAALSKQYGASVAAIIEPALTRWGSDALQEEWLQRVQDATAGQMLVSLAIEGLSALENKQAVEPLQRIVKSPGQATGLRLVAARHLGRLQQDGLVEMAQQMMAEPAPHPELPALIAVELLSSQTSDSGNELLAGLVDHDSTAVQARALERLYEIDFNLVDQHAEKRKGSSDSNVRKWIARAMIDTENVQRIAWIADILDDVNPSLRREVASGLIALGEKPELRDEVIEQSMRILNQDQWRGCEQACVVLTRLDHKPSGSRMAELLKHPRGEVKVASAWGLSQLRLEEHLPAMLDHAQDVYERFKANELNEGSPGYVDQMAHLFIAFGDQVHRPAEPLMRAYIPKQSWLGVESRAAAVWAIGFLYEDNPDAELAKQLAGRLADVGVVPETEETRQMSAVSMGRMKAESELPALRKFAAGGGVLVSRACYWAIERMTGEEPPPLEDVPYTMDAYFLSPIPEE